MLITGSVCGRIPLGAMPLGVLAAIAAGYLISHLTCWVVRIRLAQKHEFQADVHGAAISEFEAAGSSTDDIVTAASRPVKP